MAFHNNVIAGASAAVSSGGSSGYKINRSVRLTSDDDSYLHRTPSAVGNRNTFTWSGWVKRSETGNHDFLFDAKQSSSRRDSFAIWNSDKIRFKGDYNDGSNRNYSLYADAHLRDPAAWYHIVLSVDTTQATAANRIKIWVNGVEQEHESPTYPNQNANLEINNTTTQNIGIQTGTPSNGLDGYLAEVHFVDGQALSASDFGEYDSGNVWQAKSFVGSHNAPAFDPVADSVLTGTIYSGAGTIANLFDGTNTGVGPSSGSYITYTPSTPIPINSTLRVKGIVSNASVDANFKINGTSVSTVSAGFPAGGGITGGSSTWTTISNPPSSLTSLEFGWSGSWMSVSGIEIDGVVLRPVSAGVNGFYLDFSNSGTAADLGQDKSGSSNHFTVNNISVPAQLTSSDFFGIKTYTGTGSNQNITGLGFQPDLVIIKARNGDAPPWTDSVRGAGTSFFSSDVSGDATYSSVTAFLSDGFTVGSYNNANQNNVNFISYCFKAAGSTTTSNSDGTITSSVSANTLGGFSIVSYTGNGTAGATIGHGLPSTPGLIIVKNRDLDSQWVTQHIGGAPKYIKLNGTTGLSGQTDTNVWPSAATSSVFSVGTSNAVNTLNDRFIAYCFCDVPNAQKFGTYTGNGLSNGPTVTLGFKPRFLLIKGITNSKPWAIYDSVRHPSNPRAARMSLGDTSGETANTNIHINFNDDGFQVKGPGGSVNSNNVLFSYWAIGEDFDSADIDTMLDTPTDYTAGSGNNGGNYCTLNPLDKASTQTVSNGNLQLNINRSLPTFATTKTTFGISSGKFYWEFVKGASSSYGTAISGIWPTDETSPTLTTDLPAGIGSYVDLLGFGVTGSNVQFRMKPSGNVQSGSYTEGQVFGIAFDADAGKFYAFVNGSEISGQNISAGTSVFDTVTVGKTYVPFAYNGNGGSGTENVEMTFNFGQRAYAFPPGGTGGPPSGYKSLCTTNLDDPPIADPSTAFDASLWTGNGASFVVGGTKYSSLLTASGSGFRSGNPATKAFDGTDANAVTNDNNGTITFNATGLGLSGAARVRFGTGNAGTYTATFTGSSGTQTDSQSLGASQAAAWTSTYDVGTLTSISVTTTSGSQMNLMQIEVGGTVLIDGNGDPLNFSPDLLWIKARNNTANHALIDSVRGKNFQLSSSSAGGEADDANGVTSLDSSGFSLGTATAGYSINTNNYTYAAWTWDGGDLATTSDTTNYDQSQTWTSYVTGTPSASYGVANLFNGDGTGLSYSDGAAATVGNTLTWQPSTAITGVNTLVLGTYGNIAFNVNGTSVSAPGSLGLEVTIDKATYFSNGVLSNISWSYTDGSNYMYLTYIKINGKLLINPGIIPAGILNSSAYNQSQTWSSSLTASSGLSGATNAFDGDLSTRAQSAASTNQTLTFAPSTGVSFTSKLEVYCDQGNSTPTASWNGNTVNPGGGAWVTVFTGSGTINATYPLVINTQSAAQYATLKGVRLDGKILIDSGVAVTSVPAIASTVRANPSTGFSIVSYTGNLTGNGSVSVAHGLNAVPELIITKQRNAGSRWPVQHKDLADDHILVLDTTAASASYPFGDLTYKTSSVFSTNYTAGMNTNGDDFIAYCFAPVEGYSAFGSYTGNGSADGPFVHTGFKPKFILIKVASGGTSDWHIFDTTRNTTNTMNLALFPNLSNAESTETANLIDALSNGFKMRGTGNGTNASADVYIYAAFAEQPFKTSRAR